MNYLTNELNNILREYMTDHKKSYVNAIEKYFLNNKVLGKRIWVQNSLGISYYYRSSKLTEDFEGAILLGIQGHHYLNHIAIITHPKTKDNHRDHYSIDYRNIWVESSPSNGIRGGWYEGVNGAEIELKIALIFKETIQIIKSLIKDVDGKHLAKKREIETKEGKHLALLVDKYI